MFADIFRVVYRHAQNFGKENTLSAILASIFEFSPKTLLSLLDVAGVEPDAPIRRLPESEPLRIETGVTYFCSDTTEDDVFAFRPDVLAYVGDSFNDRSLDDFILIESKLDSSLTTRQLQGYPILKDKHGSHLKLLLISNSPTKDAESLFDACISWRDVAHALVAYLEEQCDTLAEQIILTELIQSLNTVGIDFRRLLFQDATPSKPAHDGLPTRDFVKLMRRRAGMTQVEFAKSVGVGLRFIRDLEQGKTTVRTDKVNDVLRFFGCELGPIKTETQQEDGQLSSEAAASDEASS